MAGLQGGGKSWALLIEPLRHVSNKNFGAVFFRRTTVQIKNQGGLWDASEELYPLIGASPRQHVLEWEFPSGATISMRHLEYDKTVLDWQGSEIPLICFDELTHFTEKQFWYMVSRNRSMSGVKPYIRATCNPDADSWVAGFIEWWIDQTTGLAIPERSGVLRYFVRSGNTLVWANTPEGLSKHTMPDEHGNQVPIPPKSVTFVSSKLTDNKALMEADPAYMANLLSLGLVERARLLDGNWKIRPAAGLYFQRSWCEVVDTLPVDIEWVRGWDLAATKKTDTNNPDWTTGTLLGKTSNGRYFVADHRFDQLSPMGVERMIKNTATDDGYNVEISIPQDPAQAGKSQTSGFASLLDGFDVHFSLESGDKITRFTGFSAQAEAGNVFVLRGSWNKRWFDSLEQFPISGKDDADSTSRAYNALLSTSGYTLAGL